MARRRIIFRADGGPEIGMGHFTRTLALAEMLRGDYECVFATRAPTTLQREEVSKVCDSLLELPAGDAGFDAFLARLRGDEIVFLDNYFFTGDYQRKIRQRGCALACVDDLHDRHFYADAVICSLPTDGAMFSVEPYTRVCSGFGYALLRAEFLRGTGARVCPERFRHAFVCFGGSDPKNLTCRTLDSLAESGAVERVAAVVGCAYRHLDELERRVHALAGRLDVEVCRNVSADGMVRLMSGADFGIVPCSGILLETISQRLPVITGHYVDNQVGVAGCLRGQFGGILVVGDLNRCRIERGEITRLEKACAGRTPDMPSISAEVPGNFRKVFAALDNRMSLSIRRARADDVDTYFDWANDPEVRANSIHTGSIRREDHIGWFASKLKTGSSFLYLFEKREVPVGQVRFDAEEGAWVVSYSVDRSFRNRGLGSVLLGMAIERLAAEARGFGIGKIRALVRKDNPASSRVFETLSFGPAPAVRIDGVVYSAFEKPITGPFTREIQ